MSVFSVHMVALAGIEILVGLTMVGTLLAVIGFFIGGSKETTPTEPQTAISANTLEEIEAALKDPSKLTVDEIQQLMERRKEERERHKMLEAMAKDSKEDDVEKPDEVTDAPEGPEKKANGPVMAILQKSDSGDRPALPEMSNVGEGPDLPSLPGESKPAEGEELERQFVEKKLQRIADKRAEHKIGAPDELPSFPSTPKAGGDKSSSQATPKPFLHELPQPAAKKSATSATPKPFLHELPQPADSANVQDVADLQTHDEERDP